MRRLSFVLLLLTLGFALATGIAWACALWAPASSENPFTCQGLGYTATTDITDLGSDLFPTPSYSYMRQNSACQAGFPLRAYACVIMANGAPEGGADLRQLHLPWATQNRKVLPLRPIWFGLAVDTVVFAMVLAISILAASQARRLSRLARRRCQHCGYPRARSAACPECGTPHASAVA